MYNILAVEDALINAWYESCQTDTCNDILPVSCDILTSDLCLYLWNTCHTLLPTCHTLLPSCHIFLPTWPVTCYYLPVTHYYLPVTLYYLPVTLHYLPVTPYYLPVTHYYLPVTCSYLYVPVTCYYLPVTQDCWTLCSHGPRTRWWGWKHWPAGPTEDAHSVNGKRMKLCIIQIKLDIILLFLGYNH